jgi:hypothetical protein
LNSDEQGRVEEEEEEEEKKKREMKKTDVIIIKLDFIDTRVRTQI